MNLGFVSVFNSNFTLRFFRRLKPSSPDNYRINQKFISSFENQNRFWTELGSQGPFLDFFFTGSDMTSNYITLWLFGDMTIKVY